MRPTAGVASRLADEKSRVNTRQPHVRSCVAAAFSVCEARFAGRSHVQSSVVVLRFSVSPCEIRCLRDLRYLSSENVPGSIGAFGTTSSNAIVFVSPLVKVIFIVSSSSDVLSIHRSSFARFSLICFRFGTIVT